MRQLFFLALLLVSLPSIAAADVGFHCRGDACYPICGDGLVRGDERCDDGNVAMYDGCADDCSPEGSLAAASPPRDAASHALRGSAPAAAPPTPWALGLLAVAHRRIR